ncbi:MAG: hypothetical protein F4X99_08365 [Gammaproteobacteria bacterium]|nr:hypothetical protein [Gammaproteobacteria bacterium]
MTQSRITFMSTVPPWECDAVEHFTVGYYFQKLEYATASALAACGLDATDRDAPRMTRCQVRFDAELRKGDVYRIETVQLAPDALGHVLVNAETEAVCTRFYQSLSASIPALPMPSCKHPGVDVPWDWVRDSGAVVEEPHSQGATWLDTGRDVVTRADLGLAGRLCAHACVLRFSAAGEHLRNRIGMTPSYARDRNVGFSTVRFDLRCGADAAVGAPLMTRSSVTSVGRTSLAIEHRLSRVVDGVEVARLAQVGVHLDKARRRPAPWPEAIVETAKGLLR